MSQLLREMIEAVERIKRDYADVPVRLEFAPDVYEKLREAVGIVTPISEVLTEKLWPPGIPCVVDPTSDPGEWGPVFKTRG